MRAWHDGGTDAEEQSGKKNTIHRMKMIDISDFLPFTPLNNEVEGKGVYMILNNLSLLIIHPKRYIGCIYRRRKNSPQFIFPGKIYIDCRNRNGLVTSDKLGEVDFLSIHSLKKCHLHKY